MSVTIRQTRGTSWRDRRTPGTRHWRSTSVTYGAGWYGLGWLAWYGIVWPFVLVPLWLTVEVYALGFSGIVVLAMWWRVPATRWRARWARWGMFWYLTARP